MNCAERRRKSRELEKQGLARVTIVVSLERVGDMLREARLIDPLGEDDKATIARGVEKLLGARSMPRAANTPNVAPFKKATIAR